MNNIKMKFPIVNGLEPFGVLERVTAGFCMAIPFILLIVDTAARKGSYWLLLLLVPLVLAVFITFYVPVIAVRFKTKKYQGAWLAGIAGFILFIFYLISSKLLDLENKPSISDYVSMRDSFIFGMVLAIGAMLFITNGAVYFDTTKRWRKTLNIWAGIFLLGVIIFPCTSPAVKYIHQTMAGSFFFLCTIGTIRREVSKEKKQGESDQDLKKKKRTQRIIDYGTFAIIAIFFVYWAVTDWLGWWIGISWLPVDLFGLECIALWIVAVDFILVSLKRENPT